MSQKRLIPWCFKGLKIWIGVFVGTWLAAATADGIAYASLDTLAGVTLLLSMLNLVVKPLLVLFTLPFVVLTLGIGVLFINAFLFWLVGSLVPGFTVSSFAAAFWGAFLVTLISLMILAITTGQAVMRGKRLSRPTGKKDTPLSRQRRDSRDDDVIIDI